MDGGTLIVLPAHNEAERIGPVIRACRKHVPGAHVAVVDDGSDDATAETALAAGATVLPLPYNMGYGAALQTGYKYGLATGAAFLVQLDADGQHRPEDIPRLLERVQSNGCDLCIGSRFLAGTPYRQPFSRRLGMVLFRRIASRVLRQTVTDPTSGFQAMNRRVVRFFSRDIYPVDYPDTDVLVLLHHHRFRVAEAPVTMIAREGGRSIHAGLRPVYYLFKMALTIPLNLLRRERGV